MSRVDEFAAHSSPIVRIEWRDGTAAAWSDDFVPDPTDNTKRISSPAGTAGAEAVVEVTHSDGTTRVYIVKVGQNVIWDPGRATYTFPR